MSKPVDDSYNQLREQPVLEEVYRQAQVLTPGRRVIWQTPLDLALKGDRDAFKQVLLILLDNALKHDDRDARSHRRG